jgi:hypothetical protein
LFTRNKLSSRYFNIYILLNLFFKNKTSTNSTLNIITSSKYLTYQALLNTLGSKTVKTLLHKTSAFYLTTLQVVSLPFAKNKLHQITYLNLYLILTNYYNYFNNYSLTTTNLNLNTNFVFEKVRKKKLVFRLRFVVVNE